MIGLKNSVTGLDTKRGVLFYLPPVRREMSNKREKKQDFGDKLINFGNKLEKTGDNIYKTGDKLDKAGSKVLGVGTKMGLALVLFIVGLFFFPLGIILWVIALGVLFSK